MKRFALLTTMVAAVLTLMLPFVGGGGPSIAGSAVAYAAGDASPAFATAGTSSRSSVVDARTAAVHPSEASVIAAAALAAAAQATDTEHLGQKPVPIPEPEPAAAPTGKSGGSTSTSRRAQLESSGQSCPGQGGGGGSAPGVSRNGITGTTSGDIQAFSSKYNAVRAANCLEAIPAGNFRYDSCMEQRLFWMAEDPSDDPMSAWGHIGSQRSDGVPSVGCDGNLAGGSGNTGSTVAQKWWDSTAHRASLYKPTYSGSTGGVCIYFAMTHGGVPNEPSGFTRAAARWGGC